MKTIEQQRAADALSRTKKLDSRSAGFQKRYRAYVDRLSPTIVMNGLGQALATELASAGPEPWKKEDQEAHHELYVSLHRWLCHENTGVYPSAGDLLQAITQHDEPSYLRAQAEALAWLQWHKKFCRASFPMGEEG